MTQTAADMIRACHNWVDYAAAERCTTQEAAEAIAELLQAIVKEDPSVPATRTRPVDQ